MKGKKEQASSRHIFLDRFVFPAVFICLVSLTTISFPQESHSFYLDDALLDALEKTSIRGLGENQERK